MILDLKKLKLRSVNEKLQNIDRKKNKRDFVISNPEGNHAVCAGLIFDPAFFKSSFNLVL